MARAFLLAFLFALGGVASAAPQAPPAQECLGSKLILPTFYFYPGSSTVQADDVRILRSWAKAMLDDVCELKLLFVSGFDDFSRSPEKSIFLSNQRAQAVAQILVGAGVSRDRVFVKAMGQGDLVDPPKEGIKAAARRRVEVAVGVVPRKNDQPS